jgi:8-oxo-dGTP pyrophosphatase MutT (NUDIX family)
MYSVCAILLCKRTHDAPIYPAHWSVFGGWIEKSEQPKDAAIREVREELGIVLPKRKLEHLCDLPLQRGTARNMGVRYFSCALDLDMDRLALQRNRDEDKVEGEGLGWFTAEEIPHLRVRPTDRSAIELFYRQRGA